MEFVYEKMTAYKIVYLLNENVIYIESLINTTYTFL